MYKFEQKMKEAVDNGIQFSEGQKTYLKCARINGIDIVDSVFEEYSKEYANHPEKTNSEEYLTTVSVLIAVIKRCEENLCDLVDQMIEENTIF